MSVSLSIIAYISSNLLISKKMNISAEAVKVLDNFMRDIGTEVDQNCNYYLGRDYSTSLTDVPLTGSLPSDRIARFTERYPIPSGYQVVIKTLSYAYYNKNPLEAGARRADFVQTHINMSFDRAGQESLFGSVTERSFTIISEPDWAANKIKGCASEASPQAMSVYFFSKCSLNPDPADLTQKICNTGTFSQAFSCTLCMLRDRMNVQFCLSFRKNIGSGGGADDGCRKEGGITFDETDPYLTGPGYQLNPAARVFPFNPVCWDDGTMGNSKGGEQCPNAPL